MKTSFQRDDRSSAPEEKTAGFRLRKGAAAELPVPGWISHCSLQLVYGR
jgi:hypothetical protein